MIPVYNEHATFAELLRRVRLQPMEKEIICVDDGSTDGTRDLVSAEAQANGLIALFHESNRGKGAAIKTGLPHCSGDVILIQDADLEYDPCDYERLLRPIESGRAQVVYGSRFLGEHRAMFFWHALGNQFLTLLTNVLFDTTLSDMETGSKVMTADVARRLRLRSQRWGFDPEITARVLRMGYRIYEVPISYAGRERWEGKKIRWHDGFVVLATLLRYRFLP